MTAVPSPAVPKHVARQRRKHELQELCPIIWIRPLDSADAAEFADWAISEIVNLLLRTEFRSRLGLELTLADLRTEVAKDLAELVDNLTATSDVVEAVVGALVDESDDDGADQLKIICVDERLERSAHGHGDA
jgi:hypothetical protein